MAYGLMRRRMPLGRRFKRRRYMSVAKRRMIKRRQWARSAGIKRGVWLGGWR